MGESVDAVGDDWDGVDDAEILVVKWDVDDDEVLDDEWEVVDGDDDEALAWGPLVASASLLTENI